MQGSCKALEFGAWVDGFGVDGEGYGCRGLRVEGTGKMIRGLRFRGVGSRPKELHLPKLQSALGASSRTPSFRICDSIPRKP